MGAGLEGVRHELRLPATEMQDPGHAPGNRVVDRREVVVDEQVMVSRPGPLDGRGDDLHPGRLEHDLDGPAERGAVRGRHDFDRRMAGLPQRSYRKHYRGTEQEPGNADLHGVCLLSSRGCLDLVIRPRGEAGTRDLVPRRSEEHTSELQSLAYL